MSIIWFAPNAFNQPNVASLEVSGVRHESSVPAKVHDEQHLMRCTDNEAEFFSVYLRGSDGLSMAVADVKDRETAEGFAEALRASYGLGTDWRKAA
jgi:hypothetical protein